VRGETGGWVSPPSGGVGAVGGNSASNKNTGKKIYRKEEVKTQKGGGGAFSHQPVPAECL